VEKPLAGRVALITGGSEGFGLGIAQGLGGEGARVVITARRQDPLDTVLQSLRKDGMEAAAVAGDMTRAEDVRRAFQAAESTFGPVDILVNNVGGFPRITTLEELSEADWRATLDLNLTSAFLCARAAAPAMKTRRWGRIVNISSSAGRGFLYVTSPAYATAKAGLQGFTRHLAAELGPFQVTVNAVAAGIVVTPRYQRIMTPELTAKRLPQIPVGRIGTIEDIAAAVCFLAGPAAGYITGATLDVNGGSVMP
jgi:3-oxoacyl-[acyl-carrier protein] reductase